VDFLICNLNVFVEVKSTNALSVQHTSNGVHLLPILPTTSGLRNSPSYYALSMHSCAFEVHAIQQGSFDGNGRRLLCQGLPYCTIRKRLFAVTCPVKFGPVEA
jgi:hypothetical protein